MSATPAVARTEIFALLKAAWDTVGHPMMYENVKNNPGIPTDESPWARAVLRHATGKQITLSEEPCYENEGVLIVQVFVPLGEGLTEGYTLCKLITDAYKNISTDGGVWFKNPRFMEIGPDGEWFQFNVFVDFTYTQV
jgi:hypothetical protein